MKKPPAFQFYVKDWRSSPTVARMSLAQRGVALELMVLSWDMNDQGCIPADPKILQKLTGIRTETLQNFFRKFPEFFQQCDKSGTKLQNDKLVGQAAKYKEISEKRTKAAESRYPANAPANDMSAVAVATAVASAPASARKEGKPAAAPPADPRYQEFFEYAYKSFKEFHRQAPTWNGKDHAGLRDLLTANRKADILEFGKRWNFYMGSSEAFTMKQGHSLGYFCKNFDVFLEGPILKGGAHDRQQERVSTFNALDKLH